MSLLWLLRHASPAALQQVISAMLLLFALLGLAAAAGWAWLRWRGALERFGSPAGLRVAFSQLGGGVVWRDSQHPSPASRPDLRLANRGSRHAAPDPSGFDEVALRRHLLAMDWLQFERLLEHVFRKQGCQVERCGGGRPRGGMDLRLRQADGLVAMQCRPWRSAKVGERNVRELRQAMAEARIRRGLLVTLEGGDAAAAALARKSGIRILALQDVLRLLLDAGVEQDADLRGLLSDRRRFCPRCEREMELRSARTAAGTTLKSWACTGQPACCFTLPCEEDTGGEP